MSIDNIDNLFWHGRVVSRDEWEANRPNAPFESPSEVKGRGYRVPVRIYSKHPRSKTILPDSDLEFIEVLGSVSGSGIGGNGDTPGITQGDEVFGLYRNGNGGDPIIIGTRLPNANVELKVTPNDDGFSGFSGFQSKDKIPNFLIPVIKSYLLENTKVVNPNQVSISDYRKIFEDTIPLQSPCDSTNINSVQLEIQKLIQKIETAKRSNKSFLNSIINPIKYEGQNISLDEYISKLISKTSKIISKSFKNVINDIRQYVIELISTKAKAFYNKLFPKEKFLVIKSVNGVLDTIFCIFNRITSNLIKIIGKILSDIVNRYVNVPLCAVENIISTIIGNIFNFIDSAVKNAIQPIKNILGSVSLLIEDILSTSQSFLALFSCDENSQCPTVKSWNPITGANPVDNININNIIQKTKQVQSNLKFDFDIDNLNFDFSGLYNTCNVGPLFCGPPTIEFIGGGGSGASANAIINSIGQIIGTDLVNSGSNYTTAPIVKFRDSCGLGSGAVAKSEINSNGEVSRIIVLEPGQNYLATYNGTQGGDGRVWAKPDQTIVKKEDGTYDQPYDPNEPYTLSNGDVKIGPFNTNDAQIFNPNYTFDSKGRYPVYLKLCDFRILNPGFDYNEKDEIIIEPKNNAEMIPKFNDYGSLIDIEIKSSGYGFESIPTVFIKTETGKNAQILPVLCVHSIENKVDTQIPEGVKLLSVVDCVGKI